MQAEADLGNPIAFEVEIDATTRNHARRLAAHRRSAESSTTGPTGRTQRKKLLGISQLVAIRWCRHRRPADHLQDRGTARPSRRSPLSGARSVTSASASMSIGTASGRRAPWTALSDSGPP